MSPAVVAWVEATRQRQGLPPQVEDLAVLDEVAAIATMRVEGVAHAATS
jgi:hypothetical protein